MPFRFKSKETRPDYRDCTFCGEAKPLQGMRLGNAGWICTECMHKAGGARKFS